MFWLWRLDIVLLYAITIIVVNLEPKLEVVVVIL